MYIGNAVALTGTNPRAVCNVEPLATDDKLLAIISDGNGGYKSITFRFEAGSLENTDLEAPAIKIRTTSGSGTWIEAQPKVANTIIYEPVRVVTSISLTSTQAIVLLPAFTGIVENIYMNVINPPSLGGAILAMGTPADPTQFFGLTLDDFNQTEPIHAFFGAELTATDIVFRVNSIGTGSIRIILSCCKIN